MAVEIRSSVGVIADTIAQLCDENWELRQLLRDYQVWAQDGVEALSSLSSAWNSEIWQERYVALQERSRKLMGGHHATTP